VRTNTPAGNPFHVSPVNRSNALEPYAERTLLRFSENRYTGAAIQIEDSVALHADRSLMFRMCRSTQRKRAT
jgi:hypothetical protein